MNNALKNIIVISLSAAAVSLVSSQAAVAGLSKKECKFDKNWQSTRTCKCEALRQDWVPNNIRLLYRKEGVCVVAVGQGTAPAMPIVAQNSPPVSQGPPPKPCDNGWEGNHGEDEDSEDDYSENYSNNDQ